MSVNSQYQADRSAFMAQAQKDGLNIQQIQQQAIGKLPGNATQQQKDDAIQTATLEAVQKTGDSTLAQNYQQLQNDHAEQLKKGPPAGGKKEEDPVDKVIAEGQKATVGEIKTCLSGLDPKDKRKFKLETMLTQAQEREKKGKEGHDSGQNGPTQSAWQPPPPSFGTGAGSVLNFMS
jgi:hypothetical protein